MTMRDTRTVDIRSHIRSELDDNVYVVFLLIWVIAASLLLYVIFDIRPAYAESACGDRTIMLEDRAKLYSERPRAVALSADREVIEVLVSPSGSWSILVNHPNRQTCVVVIGESWLNLPAVASDPST